MDTVLKTLSVHINLQGARIVAETTPGKTREIALPHHKEEVSHIAVDVGGSLAKVVYITKDIEGGSRFNFTRFETKNIDECISFLSFLCRQYERSRLEGPAMCVMATGGGAFKYYDRLRDELGVEIIREDEMECLIVGLDFFITEISDEVFTYSESGPMKFCEPLPNIYPYLLCNIGSGVSMIKVSGPEKFERIGGSSLGGGTLWGLMSILTNAKTFDEMLEMSKSGDNTVVDMLVGDIYGTNYEKMSLKSTTIASTFGKVFQKKLTKKYDTIQDFQSCFRSEDIAKSLLYAISNNIGQIAYLQARIHELETIYFGGTYIRGHPLTMHTLSYAIRFWSGGTKKAYFLRHEGYLGAVGAFLKHQPRNWGRRRASRINGVS
ncbi:pantothenate kinase [Pneumocystis murina B123]|uniref:Pantothenate kinase n=1 Tax=Pneumocystis murina (strain B123) TaxID=1069680 RepID=M7NPZ4_PNEMU|nr:pantothenate kinase [Pneumocystis murina B123]EMR09327.1 pantothenate kinase [Pneumocystis murina B123]